MHRPSCALTACHSFSFCLFWLQISKKVGIVLALNARLLAKNLPPFGDFLERYDSSQLLIWTGQGEPPIPRRKVHYIQEFFDARNLGHRIGFDVQVRRNKGWSPWSLD